MPAELEIQRQMIQIARKEIKRIISEAPIWLRPYLRIQAWRAMRKIKGIKVEVRDANHSR